MLSQLLEDKNKKPKAKMPCKKSKGRRKEGECSSSAYTEEEEHSNSKLSKSPSEDEGNSESQPDRRGSFSSQPCANKHYSFEDEHVDSLFKLLNKSNRLKLPEARCPEEVSKIDGPNDCLYHRMLGHPTKNCYVFKDILQALIDVEVLKLRPE